VNERLYHPPQAIRISVMDTRDQQKLPEHDARPPDEHYEEPGLGAWIKRNPWLLMRLFMVIVFAFSATTTAANFSYALQSEVTELSVEQLNRGELPSGIELGDYVEVTGTPDFNTNPDTGQPQIGVSTRYEVSYYYFRLEETGENLLIQQTTDPGLMENGEQVWRGKLATVGTAIFHDTTQSGLEIAGLPQDEATPIVETGDTPEYYRQIFPAYSAIIGLWVLSIVWLVWKRNKPFLGL
jgi:hypothetical protein